MCAFVQGAEIAIRVKQKLNITLIYYSSFVTSICWDINVIVTCQLY